MMEQTQPRQDDSFVQLRHDLRTPINQILGYSELLEEELEESQPQSVADLRKIQQAAKGMLELIVVHLTPGSSPQAHPDREGAAASVEPPTPTAPSPPTSILKGVPAAPSRSRSGGHLLVVDDQALNRDLLRDRLTREGYTVAIAEDGAQALEKVRRNSFDLILLDVMMPGIDGYTVLAELKQDEGLRHIPVIMISAIDEISSVARCIEVGADEYLPKPFNPTILRARIGACLEKKFLRDQEIQIYQALLDSQSQLAQELDEAARYIDSLPPESESDSAIGPIVKAFKRMSTAVERRENQLRQQIRELEIDINPVVLQGQVGSILADPSFDALSERARAMRKRRDSFGTAT